MNNERTVRTSCRGCHGVCQVLVRLDENGRITRITGDPDSLTSQGFICPKCKAGPDQLYSPDRITSPLKRVGARGENKWEKISWDEALSLIAEKFDRIRRESGPQYVAMGQGTGRPYSEFNARFLHAFGSPNFIGPSHNCFLPRIISSGITIGWFPQPDIYGYHGVKPECVVQIGENLLDHGSADGYCGAVVEKACEAARHVVVIDPRRTASAGKAEFHLQLRPGTDTALALALLHVLIGEGLYDKEFAEKYCIGFEELREHVAQFPPEWAEPITNVPAERIRGAARAIGTSRPVSFTWGNGVDRSTNAFQAGRAYLIMMAITGSLDVPGGIVKWVPPANIRPKSQMVSSEIRGMQFMTKEMTDCMIGAGRFPFCSDSHSPTFWETCISGEPYRPRALWLVGSNPLMTQTRGDLIEKAMKDHIEFTVVSDMFLTPTAQLADIFLPANHWLEQDDVVYFHKVWCVIARKKLAQVGEVRDDREVVLDLAHRLGLDLAFPWKDWEDYLKWILEPSGMTFDEFAEKGIVLGEMQYRKYEKDGFPTPSGKVELKSSIMERAGQPPLPVFEEPPISPVSRPDLLKDYPFIMMSGSKIMPFFHSAGRNIPNLRKLHPDPMVDIHPEDAAELGLTQHDKVCVSTPYGSAQFYVNVDKRMPKSTVNVEHAWWFPESADPENAWKISNVNLLYGHDHFDPQSGAEPLSCTLCGIRKITEL